MYAEDTSEPHASLSKKCCDNFLLVSCNWQISNNKQFVDAVTTAPLQHAPARVNCEDVAFLNTCISLQPVRPDVDSSVEPCMLDIKVTNCQKIARVAIVSEGNVLEIFKQFGEYETTIFTEFIDEYDENTVFLGEATIQPPTTEVSIKFTRTKNKGPSMWVYGIRLFLTDSMKEAKPSAFNYDIIQTFLSNSKGSKKAEIAMKLLGESNCNKQEIMNKNEQFSAVSNEKCFEAPTVNSNHLECNDNIEKRDNDKERLNCADNHEEMGSFECKNNVSNGKWSEGYERALRESYNGREIINNEQLSAAFQKYLKIFTSNSNQDSYHVECKNEIGKKDDEKECSSCKDIDKKIHSFEYKNGNVIRDSKRDRLNHREDYDKSDIDIRTYIDNKFHDMEKRLMERIDEMEATTNRKLDAILKRLET